MSNIFNSVHDLKTHSEIYNEKLIVTSGGFDPMHVGHLRCLLESAIFAKKVGSKTEIGHNQEENQVSTTSSS